MNNDHFTPEEQHLIDQLQALPKPRLDPAARESIRQRMVGELRTLTLDGQQPLSAPPSPLPVPMLLLVGAVVVIIVVIVVAILASNAGTDAPIATATLAASPTDILPTRATETAVFTATSTQTPVTPAAATITAIVAVTPSVTETLMPTALISATTSASGVVIEGPITSIVENTLTIYDFTIQLAPAHPILNVVNVGDVVRVEGTLGSNGLVSADVISNVADAGANSTVSIEGPVEAVAGNLITVNGIQVQLAATDPLLPTLQVGQFVSVQGNFQGSGATIVLVVVHITVVNNVVIEGNPACWYHDDGMGMGHWHCDGMGMGMGMGEDGMGMGDAMGMGN
jgi:hypothetical protein